MIGTALTAGVLGWAIENTLFGPRYSGIFQGRKVPFLPVYALGALAVITLEPYLENVPLPGRAIAYGATLSALEFLGCEADRRIFGKCSWDYSEQACAKPEEGCVDFRHAVLWAGLGLLLEKANNA